MAWHYTEQGSGRALVLLHGIGMSGAAWRPVISLLAQQRRVFAFDIPGFGNTPALRGAAPTTANLAAALGDTLTELKLKTPIDMVGNSLGGCIALEAAKQGYARTVCAISPSGLWQPGHVPTASVALKLMRWLTLRFPQLSRQTVRFAVLRSLFMAVPVSIGSWKMSRADALECVDALLNASAFEETMRHGGCFLDGKQIDVPVTVAFGSRDWLFTTASQRRDELPVHTRWLRPRGWGHVPMWDDPLGVAECILKCTG